MANDPFKHPLANALSSGLQSNGLLDLIGNPSSRPEISPTTRSLINALTAGTTPAPSPLHPFGSLSFLDPAPSTPFGGGLTGLGQTFATAPNPYTLPLSPPPKPKPVAPSIVRRAFFSFHHDDIMRVNNVRQAWKIDHPDSAENRSFRDSSLWEARKLESADAIKNLIRAGVLYTSAVCVLVGSMSWERRWVRYEIARAIIDGRGLLAAHLNNLPHHRTKSVYPRGRNPLAHMGIAKVQRNSLGPAEYFLYELWFQPDGHGGLSEKWTPYSDYTPAVKKPAWLTDPDTGYVMPLSVDTAEYDYVLDNGHRNIGSWIDNAAREAGR